MYAVITSLGVYGVFRDVNVAESAAESLGNLGINAEVKLIES
jgi:hypothetical protein